MKIDEPPTPYNREFDAGAELLTGDGEGAGGGGGGGGGVGGALSPTDLAAALAALTAAGDTVPTIVQKGRGGFEDRRAAHYDEFRVVRERERKGLGEGESESESESE